MTEINFVYDPLKDLVLSCDGCCCRVNLEGHGWAGGCKLIIDIPPE